MEISFPIQVTIEIEEYNNPFFTLDEQTEIKKSMINGLNNRINDHFIYKYLGDLVKDNDVIDVIISDFSNFN